MSEGTNRADESPNAAYDPDTDTAEQGANEFHTGTHKSGNTDNRGSAVLSSRFTSLSRWFYDRFPRLARVIATFRNEPLSGNTLRMLLSRTEEITREQQQVTSLRPATMWEQDAPIVISQYGNYSSPVLPRYWNTTLPDIQDRYGDSVRYEHHDVPVPDQSLEQYKLSTIGRAVQHNAGQDAFWSWFNALMVDGVRSADEGGALVSELGIDISRETLRDAIEYDSYNSVILDDIYSLFEKVDDDQADVFETQIEEDEPIFALFINGTQVEPSYDSIVGGIEQRQAVYDRR